MVRYPGAGKKGSANTSRDLLYVLGEGKSFLRCLHGEKEIMIESSPTKATTRLLIIDATNTFAGLLAFSLLSILYPRALIRTVLCTLQVRYVVALTD